MEMKGYKQYQENMKLQRTKYYYISYWEFDPSTGMEYLFMTSKTLWAGPSVVLATRCARSKLWNISRQV
jgi:hypothetical protein